MSETREFSLPADGNSSPPEFCVSPVTQIRWSLLSEKDKSLHNYVDKLQFTHSFRILSQKE